MTSNRTQVLGLWWTNRVILNNNVNNHNQDKIENIDDIKKLMDDIKATILTITSQSNGGESVNYTELLSSDEFASYKKLVAKLKFVDLSKLSSNQLKSFFINTYNSLVLHGIAEGQWIHQRNSTSMLSRLKLYSQASYQIGSSVYSLNDIENGVLRDNRNSPTPWSAIPFDKQDDRRQLTVKCDPRIHFALNCGAVSCPPIRSYSFDDQTLEYQLAIATSNFLTPSRKSIYFTESNDKKSRAVHLSTLFYWYRHDFGDDDAALLKWILANMESSHQEHDILSRWISDCDEGREKLPTIQFIAYDWSLNSQSK